MPSYNSPERLERLSLHRMGRYVAELGVQLVITSRPGTPGKKHLKDILHRKTKSVPVQQVCRHLRELLLNMVPYYMVNAVTLELLVQLDERLDHVSDLAEQGWCKNIIQEFVRAILHPELTELPATWKWKHIVDLVILHMGTLRNLKVFKLPVNVEFIERARTECMEFSITKQLHSMVNLQKFIFHHYCSDDTVRVLCEHCGLLRTLDIYLSNNVTDSSVKHILRLKYLEELDVTETDISYEGRVTLLRGLSQHKLRSYRCYSVTSSEICVLSREFPDLREFGASLISSDLPIREFRNFHNLEICDIYSYGEFFYCDMFKFIGQTLRRLLFSGPSVNITEIISCCPNLYSLTIKADHLRMRPQPLPELQSIQHLTLRTRDCAGATLLLSQCRNLTSLQLCTVQLFFFSYLHEVMIKNRLHSLHSLCVGSLNGNLPPEAVSLLTQNCSQLASCRVFGGQDAELRALYHDYPGVKVDPDLWVKLADNVGFANKGRKTEIVKTCVNYMYEFRSPNSFENY